ncbi:MAG: hypothetical protein IBJ18_08325 [Phycisphaerales bacterium]|nr:hypothetical protein [Phycisphaerales bacterium]
MSPNTSKREPSRARRLIVLAAVYLTLGFVSCVLVTWWMALVRPWSVHAENIFGTSLSSEDWDERWSMGSEGWSDATISMKAISVCDYTQMLFSALRHKYPQAPQLPQDEDTEEKYEIRFRAKLREVAAYNRIIAREFPHVPVIAFPDGRMMSYESSTWGWPARSLSTRVIGPFISVPTPHVSSRVIGGWIIKLNQYDHPRFVLPYSPVWPGLIVNTLLYAAAIGAIVESMMFAVLTRRRRAARCVSCGYALKGLAQSSPCPECGQTSKT